MEQIIAYLTESLAGIILAGALLLLLKGKEPLLQLLIWVFLFIYTRDLMTPHSLWTIGPEGYFWFRFTENIPFLILFGLISVGLVVLMNRLSPELKEVIVWQKGSKIAGCIWGIAGAFIVVLPFALNYLRVPLESRGGSVPLTLLPLTLFLALTGNFYEEVLFRGYIQGWMEKKRGFAPLKSALFSGIFFSFGHLFLSYNVTGTGSPLLVFTLWEGTLAGVVRSRWGVLPAVLTHGLAVFIMTSGLI